MSANSRLIGIFLLATLAAAAATLFGTLAVPKEHPHGEATEHHEAEAAHSEEADTLGPGDLVGALLVSMAGIGLVPLALRNARCRNVVGRRATRPEGDASDALRLTVALASAGAATIHFAVIAQHLEEYWLFGAFFIGVAVLQLAWALAVLLRPSPMVYVLGLLGNAAVAAMWVVSRTTGLPLGPESAEPEPVGFADAIATAFEVLIVAGALLLLLRTTARSRPLARFPALTVATTLAAIGLTTLSLLSLTGL